MSDKTPITLLTGFLGSGKTTILRELLRQQPFKRAAVVIGEFGEIAIDHHLIRALGPEVVTLIDGCPCCTLQGDLVGTLRELWRRRSIEHTLDFDHILIESSGISEPGPVLNAILSDPALRTRLEPTGVLCTVDAVHFRDTLDRRQECLRQIALSDHLIVTKADLVESGHVRGITNVLHDMAPEATIHIGRNGQIETGKKTFDNPSMLPLESSIDRWLGMHRRNLAAAHPRNAPDTHAHGLVTFSLTAFRPLHWPAVVSAFSDLLAAHGHEILRIKGILDIVGRTRPTVIHAIQHVLYPPAELSMWANDERCSQVVFITERLNSETVKTLYWNRLATD